MGHLSGVTTKTIRVAFYKGPRNWRTGIVSWWTGSIYTHVELVLPSGDCIGITPEGTAGIRLLRNPEMHDAEWDFIDLQVSREQLTKIVAFFTHTHGQKYDWTGMIVSHLTPFYVKHDRKWYCSQWIACALTISDVFSFMYNKINPGKLHDILHVKVRNGPIPGSIEDE